MRKFIYFISALALASFTLTSCTSDDDSNNSSSKENIYKDGIVVLAEGAMGANNADITFFKNGKENPNIFKTVNNQPLGDIAQSILFNDKLAYIVINGSNTIRITDASSFSLKGNITANLNNPRYAVTDKTYLYVSNWGDPIVTTDDYISVYRLADLAFVKKIGVKEGPEQLIIKNNKLIIAHKGGWNNGNSVSIYNTSTDKLDNIIVGDIPSALVEEKNQVYILCSGIAWGETPSPGKIMKLDLNNNQITQTINFKDGENPNFLVEDNDQLYYTINNKIYKIGLNSTSLPAKEIFTSDAAFVYGFNVKNNTIYVADAKDFASNGEVTYYNQTGTVLGKFETGIGPNSIKFN